MTKSNKDMTKAFADMFANFPVDMTQYNDMVKTSAQFGEKLSKVALAAAEQSAEISNKWTKETLSKMAGVTKAQTEPSDYAKVVADYTSNSMETAAEHMAAYAEVAKKVQADTVELVLAAGKTAQTDAAAAMQKVANEATEAVKKATKAA